MWSPKSALPGRPAPRRRASALVLLTLAAAAAAREAPSHPAAASSPVARGLGDASSRAPSSTPTPVPAGSLDATFGAGGRLLIDVGGPGVESCATAVAVQPDGRVVVVGEVGGRLVVQDGVVTRNVTAGMDFAVIRLNPDGSPDQTFGTGGRVVTDISQGDAAFAVALQPDGRVVVAGVSNAGGTGQSDFALVRYNADGSLDATFDGDGKATADLGGADRAYGVAVQSDQRIVAAGIVGGSFGAARFNADGSPDNSFGSGGKVSVTSGAAFAVALQADQKIVLAGGGSCDFVAARLDAGGTPDPSFGAGGKTLTDLGFGFCDEAHGLALQPDGKLVLAGDLTAKQFALVRYDTAGAPDPSFGDGGRVITPFTQREAVAQDVVVRPDGKMIAVGGAGPGFEPPNQPPAVWALASYNPDGSPNTFFGDMGRLTTVMSNSSNRQQGGTAMGAALQPDAKKVVVVGSAFESKGVFGVARYLAEPGEAPPGGVSFSAAVKTTSESGGGPDALTVVRTGDTSGPASVDYESADGTARQSTDYSPLVGTLNFAPGETAKTIPILRTEDGFDEPDETFTVTLSNPSAGVSLNAPVTITVVIADGPASSGNPNDDSEDFVRQHYHDFLNREPDAAGLAFWKGQTTGCGNADLLVCRINVSAAFFLSPEFQDTGFFVVRVQRVASGRRSDSPAARVGFRQFVRDARLVGQDFIGGQAGSEQVLENNKQAYAVRVVSGAEFVADFPATLSSTQYVDALFAKAGAAGTAAERQAAVGAYDSAGGGAAGRAAALRVVAESASVRAAEFRGAFVLMQYFGYLRRDPDEAGYQFWLGKLNEFNGDYVAAEMVKAFITSTEYRERFGQP